MRFDSVTEAADEGPKKILPDQGHGSAEGFAGFIPPVHNGTVETMLVYGATPESD